MKSFVLAIIVAVLLAIGFAWGAELVPKDG